MGPMSCWASSGRRGWVPFPGMSKCLVKINEAYLVNFFMLLIAQQLIVYISMEISAGIPVGREEKCCKNGESGVPWDATNGLKHTFAKTLLIQRSTGSRALKWEINLTNETCLVNFIFLKFKLFLNQVSSQLNE